MTNIADIMDTAELNRLVKEGYITCVYSPDGLLTLFDYKEKARWARLWTNEVCQCRGLVIDTVTGDIIARPLSKFPNVNEPGFPESDLALLFDRPGPIEITEKLDGTLINVWWNPHTQDWCCSTRNSFTSSQAVAARQWLRPHIINNLTNWKIARHDYTVICEWCAPDNRVVLRYEQPELRVIGVRAHDGIDVERMGVLAWADFLGLPVVPTVTGHDLHSLIEQRTTVCGVEGWVVRWPDGFRIKVKTDDYIRLHKLISGFSPAKVRDAMVDGSINRYIQTLPEEIRSEAERMCDIIHWDIAVRQMRILDKYHDIQHRLAESRKAYAQAVMQESVDDRPYLFMLADGKPIGDKLLKELDLKALFGGNENKLDELTRISQDEGLYS